MKARVPTSIMAVALLTSCMMISGCISDDGGEETVEPGELQTETRDVELGAASSVEVYLEQGRGSCRIRPGGTELMEATFRYNIPQWRPLVSYVEQGAVWNLTVEQPNETLRVGLGERNEWDLRFGGGVPTRVVAYVGVGDLDCKVAGLNLSQLACVVGVGNLAVDLSGAWEANLTATLNAGTGSMTIVVPSDVGVIIVPFLGTGNLNAPGFTQQGSGYVNAAYGTAPVFIAVNANAGVGDIAVTQVP
jgi:hypothetical protein